MRNKALKIEFVFNNDDETINDKEYKLLKSLSSQIEVFETIRYAKKYAGTVGRFKDGKYFLEIPMDYGILYHCIHDNWFEEETPCSIKIFIVDNFNEFVDICMEECDAYSYEIFNKIKKVAKEEDIVLYLLI